MVFRDNHFLCPRCGSALEETRNPPGHRFRRCDSCTGNWVDYLNLRAMFDRLKPGHGIPEMWSRHDQQPTLLCPECGSQMHKRFINRLALDQCEAHGVWFDGAELEQTLYQYALSS